MTYREFIQSAPGTKASLDVDLCVLNDNISVEMVKLLRECKAFDPAKTIIIIDQKVPANSPETSAVQRQLMQLSDEQEIPVYYGRIMTSQYLTEIAKPEQVIVAKNPTVVAAGVNGALGVCVDDAALIQVFETGKVDVEAPEAVELQLHCSKDGVYLKDTALKLISCTEKTKFEKKLVAVDREAINHYSAEEVAELFTLLTTQSIYSAVVESGVKAESAVEINLDEVVSMAALENSFSDIYSVNEIEAKSINVVFIGGSTGGTFANIEKVAKAVKGKSIAYGVRLSVAPASSEIYSRIVQVGYLTDILNAGGLVLNQCADPEIQCRVGINEIMVSNDWKNNPGYAGYDSSEVILTNTETAIKAALSGTIGTKTAKETVEEKTIVIEGRSWKFGDDIDTDIIIPTQWVCVPMEEMKRHAFEPLRPELAAALQDGDIIVAGDNFGCGSSREMAAEVIKENGVRCIIAKSFARIFFRNAINNGILLIECPELPDHVTEGDIVRVELNHQITCNGNVYPIGKIHQNLYEIIADGGLVHNVEKKVKRGEL